MNNLELIHHFKNWWKIKFGTDLTTGTLQEYQQYYTAHNEWYSLPERKAEVYYNLNLDDPLTKLALTWHLDYSQYEIIPLTTQELVNYGYLDIADYKAERLVELSETSKQLGLSLIPQYKRDNVNFGVVGYTDPTIKANYGVTLSAFRVEYYRVKAIVDVATTVSDIDIAINTANFPNAILEA